MQVQVVPHWDSTTMKLLQQNSLMSSTRACHMRDTSGLDLMCVAEKKQQLETNKQEAVEKMT